MNLNGFLITEARKLILTHTVLGISTPLKYQHEERGESGRIFNGKFQKRMYFFFMYICSKSIFLVRKLAKSFICVVLASGGLLSGGSIYHFIGVNFLDTRILRKVRQVSIRFVRTDQKIALGVR